MSTNLLVLEDRVIQGLLGDPRVLAAIPCLKSAAAGAAAAKAGCGRCDRKQRQARTLSNGNVRQCIAGLPAAQRDVLKQLVGARQIRVTHRNAQGKAIVLTF